MRSCFSSCYSGICVIAPKYITLSLKANVGKGHRPNTVGYKGLHFYSVPGCPWKIVVIYHHDGILNSISIGDRFQSYRSRRRA